MPRSDISGGVRPCEAFPGQKGSKRGFPLIDIQYMNGALLVSARRIQPICAESFFKNQLWKKFSILN